MEYKIIKEDNSLVRDEETNAVLNTNTNALEAYKLQRDKQRKVENVVSDVENLKNDLKDIKNMLEKILTK